MKVGGAPPVFTMGDILSQFPSVLCRVHMAAYVSKHDS